jgi:hypothetical protein
VSETKHSPHLEQVCLGKPKEIQKGKKLVGLFSSNASQTDINAYLKVFVIIA